MKIILFILFSLSAATHAQDSVEKSFSLGTRGSYFMDLESIDNSLNFIHAKYRTERFLESATLKTNLEVRAFDPTASDEKTFVDPVNVSLELLFDKVSFQAGFLRYRFSETFGLQILDVANPRDYSDYVLNDLAWAKRSVFGLNMQNRWERLEILWMLTLWGNGDRLPYQNSPFDLSQGSFGYEGGVIERPWFKNIEYGARAKYLFESGLDLSVLAYHHNVRPANISLNLVGPLTFRLEEQPHMVDSLGMAGSFVLEDWVLRGDALLTFKDLVQTSSYFFEEDEHFQFLIGIDRILDNWTIGGQLQSDFTYERNFVGVKIENARFEFWKPSIMAFVSDKHADKWFQLKNSFEYQSWNLQVIYDYLDGDNSTDALFGPYQSNDRVLVEIAKNY